MDPEFWLQRWQENRIGFHLDEVNPLLINKLPMLGIRPPARVFVPMCGKSVDMVWLRAQGYEVEAVEISPLAIEAFFEEQQVRVQTQTIDGMPVWQADGIRIWGADFFALSAEHIGKVAMTYDRAALIAMPPEKQPAYAQHLLAITEQAPQLLITLDYPQVQMAGPPFSLPHSKVVGLYGHHYKLSAGPDESLDVLASHERFAARGLTELHENVYLLQVPKK